MQKLTTLLTGVLISCQVQALASDHETNAQLTNTAPNDTTSAAVKRDNSHCYTFGDNLAGARGAYSRECTLTRVDCDPVVAGWVCASHRMVGDEAGSLWAQLNGPSQHIQTNDQLNDCLAVGDNLALARRAYRDQCSSPRQDCDPLSNGRWLCASRRIATGTADALIAVRDQDVEEATIDNSDTADAQPFIQEDSPDTGDDSEDDATDNTPTINVQNDSDTAPSRPTYWSDSYAVDGQCYCDSAFDHGLNDLAVETPDGMKSVRQVCADISATFGSGGLNRTYYNTIQCGHPPANNAPDESRCPGVLGGSAADCQRRGATWNLELVYPQAPVTVSAGSWWQPKASDQLSWQLQLQGDINTDIEADVYFIDAEVPQATINALKSQGKRVMCYISAGSIEDWRSDANLFPRSVIGNDYNGWPGEKWLNIRDIDALAPVMRARLDLCQRKGFDGIDADNVNGHVNNTGFSLTREDVIRFIRWLADESHARGMAFSLKNASDVLATVAGQIDMIQMESCQHWGFCDDAVELVSSYNKPVFMVEYSEINRNFDVACNTAQQLGYAAIYRNLQLTGDGIYRSCD